MAVVRRQEGRGSARNLARAPLNWASQGQRDKANLDIFWLRDESLEDSENLPPPDVIAEEIMEDLRAALEQLEEIAADLGAGRST